MENAELSDKNRSYDEDGASTTLIYGKSLEPPILGNSYRLPDIPSKYIEPTVLDASLSYIPVYTHLKTYDLKPIERPRTPTTLSMLRSKYGEDTASCVSSKATPSTGRTSKRRTSVSIKTRENEKL